MEQLGRYRLFHELGAGGFASVYKAEMVSPEGFRSQVAVKRLHPHLTRSGMGIVESLMTEAKACSRIHHHNVVQVYELSSEPDDRGDLQWFMVMELVEGASLEELPLMAAKRGERLPPSVVLDLLIQVASGLHHVHTLQDDDGRPIGMIHRDLKPSNVLVRFDGVAKILDFGIAKSLYEGGPQTATGITRGTAAYMAPEQAFARALTPKADQFAFGALLFFIVLGEQLVRAESLAAELLFVVNTPAGYRADEVDAHVPGLGAVFQRIRQPRLEDRYDTMADVLADLLRVQESLVEDVEPADYLADLIVDPRAHVSAREMMRFRGIAPGDEAGDPLTLDQLGPQTLDRKGNLVPAKEAARSWGMNSSGSDRSLGSGLPGATTPSGPSVALDTGEVRRAGDNPDRMTAELRGLDQHAPGSAPLTADLPVLETDEQEALNTGDLPRARMEDAVTSSAPRALDSGDVPRALDSGETAAARSGTPAAGMPVALDTSEGMPVVAPYVEGDTPAAGHPTIPRASSGRPSAAPSRSWAWLVLVPLLLGVLALVGVAVVSLWLSEPELQVDGMSGELVHISDLEEEDPFGRPDHDDIVIESEEDRAREERRQRRREKRERERLERGERERTEIETAATDEEEDGELDATEAEPDDDDGGSGGDEVTETGVLKLNAYPAAKVFVDGKSVGTTLETAQGVRLPVGKHKIRLERTTDGFERTITVTIKAKKVLSVPFSWDE